MIFSDNQQPNNLSVDAGSYDVYVATCVPNNDPTADPKWNDWKRQPAVRFDGCFYGSSVVGMSYAKVSVINAPPVVKTQVNVENDATINVGDRVAIVVVVGNSTNCIFQGYATGGSILIDEKAERLSFHIAGPEWIWGAEPQNGAAIPIVGQRRRSASDDDVWILNPGQITHLYPSLNTFTDERAIFNPGGRKNMTSPDDVYLYGDNNGQCFEIPDRMNGTTPLADFWTPREACRYLDYSYNDLPLTGITNVDWDNQEVIPDTDTMGEVNIDGLGLWEAFKRAAGPKYAFYVDPRPTVQVGNVGDPAPPGGSDWGPFNFAFIVRGTGPAANLYLNKRGTTASAAIASVQRLQAVKSIDKVVNSVDCYARLLRHVKLMYYSGDTASAHAGGGNAKAKNCMLQQGWTKNDIDFGQYHLSMPGTGAAIDINSIDVAGKSDLWRDQFTTTGVNFDKYRHVMRLFVWNESGEYPATATGANAPWYSNNSTATELDWWTPDLTDIADGEGGDAGNYCRRRRRILDTVYPDPSSPDGWRRVPPTLFISSDQQNWVRVHSSNWRLDHERAAVWITARDLAEWTPLEDHSVVPEDEEEDLSNLDDARTFATLLDQGVCYLMLEGSIAADCMLKQTADRQASSGSPFVRKCAILAERDFIKTEVVDDGITSPLGIDADPIDTSDKALTYAKEGRAAWQNMNTHASILCSADWQLQAIGSMCSTINGRNLSLGGGAGGGGSGGQIVAMHLDPASCKIELLTETTALKVRKLHKLKFEHDNRKRPAGVTQAGDANPARRDPPRRKSPGRSIWHE